MSSSLIGFTKNPDCVAFKDKLLAFNIIEFSD